MSEPLTVDATRHEVDVPWYAIDEWSLRRKLALALTIPMLLAATFGGLRVADAANAATTFSRLEDRIAVLKPAVRMVDSAAAAVVAGRGADRAAADRARDTFDGAVADLRRAMREANLTNDQVMGLDRALASVQPLRDSPPGAPAASVTAQLAETVGHVTVVLTGFSGATSDTRLTTVRDILAGQVALTEQRLLTTLPADGAAVDPLALGSAIGKEATAITALTSSLGATDTFVVALAQGNELRLSSAPAVAAGTAGLPRAQDAVSVYTTLANRITDQVLASMRARASDARGTAIRDAVATIGLLLAAVLLALAVARMLLDPITRVRLGALDVANEELPLALERIRAGEDPPRAEPIAVHTREEVGQLARAVDVLHSEALRLAAEQARLRRQVSAMFETLSRRSTSLINQQLSLIENLERDEDDPRRLESLFRLDHLAARIRRNGESLLVLAGAATRGTAGPDLPLGDVLRAAVSEVQDYQRVQLAASRLVIRASVAPNLVHLLAELIDNALSYSPPDSTVRVVMARGVDGGTLVEIVDDGLGMAAEAMQTANDALVNGGEVTPETARRMGLYVVGQLASRHQVTVRIRPNPDSTGTVASVFLPASLLASGRSGDGDVAGAGTVTAIETANETANGTANGTEAAARRDDPAYAAPTAAATTADGHRPRVTTLTAVPNLPAEPGPNGSVSLTATPPTATPTALPQVGGTAPLPVVPALGMPTSARYSDPAGGPAPTASSAPAPAPAPAPAAAPQGPRRRDVSIRDLEPTPVAGTPIFRQLTSSWLSENGSADLPWASEEIDEGWRAAARAASAQPVGRSPGGLPVRRPGSTLVPGQVGTGSAGTIARDPEAIRRHLNRHRAGVQRGRHETGGQHETSAGSTTLLDEEKN